MTNVGLQKLLTLYNQYKSETSEGVSFENFLIITGYLNAENKDFAINNVENLKTNSSFSFDNVEFDEHNTQLSSFISFVAENELNDKEINDFMNKIVIYMILKKKQLALSSETADKVVNGYNTYLENPKLEKSHPKRSFLFKKVGIPTVITSALCALAGGIFGWVGALPGSSALWTASTLGNALSIGSIGLMAALVATPAVILIKNLITKAYYSKKYGVKNNNLGLLNGAELSEEGTIDFEKIPLNNENGKTKYGKLPICELLDIIETERKELANKNNYFKRKRNRNREHEVVNFYFFLLKNIDACQDETQKRKMELLKSHIQDHVYACFEANLSTLLENKLEGKSKNVVHDMDIMSAIILGDNYSNKKYHKNGKAARQLKKDNISSLSKNIAMELLTANNPENRNMLTKMSKFLKENESVKDLAFEFKDPKAKKAKKEKSKDKDKDKDKEKDAYERIFNCRDKIAETLLPGKTEAQEKLMMYIDEQYNKLKENPKDKAAKKALEEYFESYREIKNAQTHESQTEKTTQENNEQQKVDDAKTETVAEPVNPVQPEPAAEEKKTEEAPAEPKTKKAENPKTSTRKPKVPQPNLCDLTDDELVNFFKKNNPNVIDKRVDQDIKNLDIDGIEQFGQRLTALQKTYKDDRKIDAIIETIRHTLENDGNAMKARAYSYKNAANLDGKQHVIPTGETEKKEPEAEQKKSKPKIPDMTIDQFIDTYTTPSGKVSSKVKSALGKVDEQTLFTSKLKQLLDSEKTDNQAVILEAIQKAARTYLAQTSEANQRLQEDLNKN